jgi:hypothetical protein
MDSADRLARRLWTLYDPVHAVTYFSPEALSAFTQAGLRGFWRGYFAGRSAPLGAVAAAPVTASFFNFAPSFVSRALPAVWELITPAEALAVRQAGAVAALNRLLADVGADIKQAADLLVTATEVLDIAGRVLASANAALPVPEEPMARLWHAATVLREHRGDAHFAALLASDIDGCEAVVLQADKKVARARIQPVRGWTDEDWENAAARLVIRGLLTEDGKQTSAGAELTADIEHRTDVAAARPWQDQALAVKAAEVLLPIAIACMADLAFPNPIGLPAPGAGQ